MTTYFYGCAEDLPRGAQIAPKSPIGADQWVYAYSTVDDASEMAVEAALERWDREGRDEPYQPSWARVYEVEFTREPEPLLRGVTRSPFPMMIRRLALVGTGDPIPDS